MEVTLKALSHRELYEHCIPVVIGDKTVAEDALEMTGLPLTLRCICSGEGFSPIAGNQGEYGTVDLLDMGLLGKRPGGGWDYGKISAAAGDAAFRYVKKAVTLALEKSIENKIDAIVTAPINKEAINLAGHHYAGHTEILADFTGTKDYTMILVCGALRVIHVTSHVSLRAAADLITTQRVLTVIRLARQGLKQMGFGFTNRETAAALSAGGEPRIAVAGFNPHASEGGLFGDEEERAIIPAVEAALNEGIDVTGPLPPDTVFAKAAGGQFDAVVAMYHDQGHIPLKLIGFKLGSPDQLQEPKYSGNHSTVSGINCTLGLPIIRTSVDHGTAFDKAGKNCSSEQSIIEAIEAAYTMAINQNKTAAHKQQ